MGMIVTMIRMLTSLRLSKNTACDIVEDINNLDIQSAVRELAR